MKRKMISRTIRMAAGAAGAATLMLTSANGAAASTVPASTAVGVEAAACAYEQTEPRMAGENSVKDLRVVCLNLPAGVQAGFQRSSAGLASELWTPGAAAAGAQESAWVTVAADSAPPELTYRADQSGIGSHCTAEVVVIAEKAGLYDEHAVRLECSQIAPWVQVRAVGDYELQGDTHSPWLREVGIMWTPGQTRSHHVMPMAKIEYGLRPAPRPDVGSDCTAEIYITYERSLRYDEHAAKVTCTSLAPGVKVRVVGDYSLQSDTYSDWLVAPGTVGTPAQTRTDAAMPTARIEYAWQTE